MRSRGFDAVPLIGRYSRWLHTCWPAGKVENLPEVREDGSTRLPGLYVVGDLTGVPLLKLSAESGAKAVRTIVERGIRPADGDGEVLDLAIVGGGVSGPAAAIEASRQQLSYRLYEAAEPFSTIVNFPRGKPIYTYPTDLIPAGDLQFHEKSVVKEGLLEDLREQAEAAGIVSTRARVERVRRKAGLLELTLEGDGGEQVIRARRVIVAIGRSGNHRKLGVPGEDRPHVYNRLHDPAEFVHQKALVVGGGDSACETALALCDAGAEVTLSYRGETLARPKPENAAMVESRVAQGKLGLRLSTEVQSIEEGVVTLRSADRSPEQISNDVVFSMIGREAPLDFFRRSGIPIRGEWSAKSTLTLIMALAIFTFVYHWKKTGVWIPIGDAFTEHGWFPYNLPQWWAGLGESFSDRSSILGTLKVTIGEPGFWYSLVYTLAILIFGVRRIRRRNTPYVTRQTWTLFAIQAIPLFLLPYIVLPYLGNQGVFDSGFAQRCADEFFPEANYGHGREYWRAFGFILAWPLFFWNVFTSQPMWGWLAVSFIQTFVLIPLLIRRYGKGVYCGWICSCGALAETVGDAHRSKMPHGPAWNRLNMIGQLFLLFATILLVTRIGSWIWPDSGMGEIYRVILDRNGLPGLNYVWFVDLLWAGILGVGLYWHFSGRVWCRFACPLAALMHIYTRFSRFAIVAEKKKCISCNVCTSVCHQGIDIMSFANKGLPMEDPECVRCSACVQSCPTGVLRFGRYGKGDEIIYDAIPASLVQMAEVLGDRGTPTRDRLFGIGGKKG